MFAALSTVARFSLSAPSFAATSQAAFYSRVAGNVKFFNSSKGFGFITLDDGSDIFVHQTAIQADGFRSLAEGERVELDVDVNSDEPDKRFASRVTGPGGVNVQGAPRPQSTDRTTRRRRRDDYD